MVEGWGPWARASAKMSVREWECEWESQSGHQWEKDSVPSSVLERKDSVLASERWAQQSVRASEGKAEVLLKSKGMREESVRPSERVWAQQSARASQHS